ncbi:arylamine N-acetyltransferase [Streptomyces sp. NPDC101132]|uniref:arylamine N-acetyltransferase family protein n=1 Tax=Streptomyces sp. NPDC101132 TaxID=3366110 RepID=UPI0038213E98
MWSGDELDLDAYLERIGYAGPLEPTAETLAGVHRAHVTSVPFENLDVALGRPVPLDLASVQDKLVRRRRGGYCYEQNSLLAAALERLGFEVAGRGARNRTRGAGLTPVTHAVLVVAAGGRSWLADAGFGHQGPLEPVPLDAPGEVRQGAWTYAVGREDDGVLVLRMFRDEGWRDLYAFAPQRTYPVDLVPMNHYSSTHPRSHFTGQIVVQKAGEGLRAALVRDTLTELRADGSTARRTAGPAELAGLLAREFGIGLSEADTAELVGTYWPGVRTGPR